MSELFNENMTSREARMALWEACDGKTKEERLELLKEYEPVSNVILKRELNQAYNGMMC